MNLPESQNLSALQTVPDPLPTASRSPDRRPNIFFIILDSYAGDLALQKYGYDNSGFLKALESRGFYVAHESRSNYWMTRASLASLLNYRYIDFMPYEGIHYHNSAYCSYLRNHNRVFRFLKDCGYTTVQCRTDVCHAFDTIESVDLLWDTPADPWAFGLLSRELLGNTPIDKILCDLTDETSFVQFLTVPKIRRAVHTAIKNTKQMAHSDKPFICFTHFFPPHPPAAFTETGDYPGTPSRFDNFPVNSDNPQTVASVRSYLASIEYMNKCMIELIDYILEHSEQPPVIVLQGDHGSRFRITEGPTERAAPEIFSILNAMYLPGCDYSTVYPSISSINTFPVILNHYFGTDIPLLEDRSFYAEPGPETQDFRDLTAYIR